jgi:beta-glucosidase
MGGLALAEVLNGNIAPSGKLPMTWPRRLEDVPAYATGTYPQKADNSQGDIFVGLVNQGQNARAARGSFQPVAHYAEESLVGYRWYDCKDVPVAYPFGYGLSYAQFQYSDPQVTPTAEGFDVRFTLTNTSPTEAEEVAQVYVSRPQSHIKHPVKELKGFQRVALKAGERKAVTIPVRRSDLCHWDAQAQGWMLEPGSLIIQVGGWSDNLPLHLETKL